MSVANPRFDVKQPKKTSVHFGTANLEVCLLGFTVWKSTLLIFALIIFARLHIMTEINQGRRIIGNFNRLEMVGHNHWLDNERFDAFLRVKAVRLSHRIDHSFPAQGFRLSLAKLLFVDGYEQRF